MMLPLFSLSILRFCLVFLLYFSWLCFRGFGSSKPEKSDGTQLDSNDFICAATSLSAPVSKLFTAMLRHGYVPESLKDCVLRPIVKPGKDPCDSDSYRRTGFA